MKKYLLFAAFIFACFSSFSQTVKTWTKTDSEWYGTPKEKAEQEGISNKVGYELYRLIGFKEYYANGLASYLQENGYNMDDAKDIKGGSIFVFSQRVGTGSAPKLYIKYMVNSQKRITSMRITGYPMGLASLFVSYWPTDIQWSSVETLKKGVIATKMLINESITYNSAGAAPFIEITK
jgi:hypothetical protein